MKRREFIAVLGGAVAVWPLAGYAQQPQRRLPLVGGLWQGSPSAPIISAAREAFQLGLREEGYLEGQNITLDYRYGEDLNELRKDANELVSLNVDVIIAGGTPAALAAKHATNTIPIVVGTMADPLADGLVASIARPGGNVTGNTFLGPELGPKHMQLLRELVVAVTRIAVLQHPRVYSERTMRNMVTGMEEAAKASGVQLQIVSAAGPDDLDDAFDAMVNARAGALIILPSTMFYVNHRRLVELAAAHRLPTMYVFKQAVKAGGLVSYGANIPDLVRRAGKYVAKILKGAKSADLPVEQPTKFELVINLKTARTLGLTVPPQLLALADEVIE
jgi:putative ABC transport system substrate-binding protein